jgi:hypothetical protein
MGWTTTLRAIGESFGVLRPDTKPIACLLGRSIYRDAKRAAVIANIGRRPRRLKPETERMLRQLFPELDVERIRCRTDCRLPANRFKEDGRFRAMTFGYSIFWRGELDETDPRSLVTLIHEVVHVDQVRRLGGERQFACEYGIGYVAGGGELPSHVDQPSAYHRNPLEAEAIRFASRFQDASGRAVRELIPWHDG